MHIKVITKVMLIERITEMNRLRSLERQQSSGSMESNILKYNEIESINSDNMPAVAPPIYIYIYIYFQNISCVSYMRTF